MEPKFQSSFIPRGPITSATAAPIPRTPAKKGLLSFLAVIIFSVSVLAAVGTFGYKFYLNYRIDQMGADLETARAALQPEIIRELTRADNRLISAKNLISNHHILSPLFGFLEVSTPKSVRFNDFNYIMTAQGSELHMKGEARGYSVLAQLADIFQRSSHFINPTFSDLRLNENGNVRFSFSATIEPDMISYMKEIERIQASEEPVPADEPLSADGTGATSTATSTSN